MVRVIHLYLQEHCKNVFQDCPSPIWKKCMMITVICSYITLTGYAWVNNSLMFLYLYPVKCAIQILLFLYIFTQSAWRPTPRVTTDLSENSFIKILELAGLEPENLNNQTDGLTHWPNVTVNKYNLKENNLNIYIHNNYSSLLLSQINKINKSLLFRQRGHRYRDMSYKCKLHELR